MTLTRKNVWELDGAWADPIVWYVRGVAAMKARVLASTTSWRFYAAIHGFKSSLWQQGGHLSTADPMPSTGDVGAVLGTMPAWELVFSSVAPQLSSRI